MATALDISQLRFQYKGADRPCLDGISLTLETGHALAVTGPAASGKTSFCLCLKGLIPQAREGKLSGSIHTLGKDVSQFRAQTLSRETALVLQDPEVQIVGRTVFEDLAFGPRNFLVPAEEIREEIPRVLEAVGMAGYEERATMELSGGEKQRLAVAGALMTRPRLLILDDPASELDPDGRARLYALLRRLKDRGTSLVIVDSRLDEMGDLIDQLLVLDQGRCAYAGPRKGAPAPPRIQLPRPRPRPTDTAAAVKINNLDFSYNGTHPILSRAGLTLPRGGFTALMGRNGAGKTSLVKHLNGLIPCGPGKIQILDRDITDFKSKELTRTVGFVFQNPDHQIFESSVEKEIAFGLSNRGLDKREIQDRVDQTLDQTGLASVRSHHPFTLGKGMRQMIAVASILALDPAILIVDEPTTGLDPEGAARVMELIQNRHAQGTSILFISHDLNLVLAHAQRLALMDRGKIILDSPVDELHSHGDLLARAGISAPQGKTA